MLIRTMFALLFVVLIVCVMAVPFRSVIARYLSKKPRLNREKGLPRVNLALTCIKEALRILVDISGPRSFPGQPETEQHYGKYARCPKNNDDRRGGLGACLRGFGIAVDRRRGKGLHAGIRVPRLSVYRRQRRGGVRHHQSLLRAPGRTRAADHRRQAQLQYGPGQVRDRRRRVLGHRRLHGRALHRAASWPFRSSISICRGSRSAACGRCTPRR